MSIPGVQCKIRVEDLYNKTIFFEEDKTFASHEAIKDFGKSNYGLASNRLALVVPIRTNNIKNFASDLLFPTLAIFSAKKVHVIAKAIMTVIVTVIDLISLPVRLVTAIPRSIYNHVTYKEPKLYTFLKGEPGINPKTLLKCDCVSLRITSEKKEVYQNGERERIFKKSGDGCVHFIDTLRNHNHCNFLVGDSMPIEKRIKTLADLPVGEKHVKFDGLPSYPAPCDKSYTVVDKKTAVL